MRRRFHPFLILLTLLITASAALAFFFQASVNEAPIRSVRDRFPVFADVAVDPDANIVAVTDENLFSLRTYDRDLLTNDVADPRTVITGSKSRVDFVCGVAVDPVNKDLYAINIPASRTLRPAPVST